MGQSKFDISSRSKGFLKSFTALFFLTILGCQQEQPGNNTAGIQETVTNPVIAQDAPPTGDFEFYDLEPLPLEDMKVVSYSKDFSQRIGIPLENAEENMPAGLHAIEFSAAKYVTPTANFYTCHFKLYLDSSLDIWFPGNSSVGNSVVLGARHFFQNSREKAMALQEEDRARLEALLGSHRRKAYWTTQNYKLGELGARTGLYYQDHYQDLIMGVDYVNLEFDCGMHRLYSNIDSRLSTIWLERIGGADYTTSWDLNPQDFFTFDLPSSFISEIYFSMKTVHERNSEIRERRYNSTRR